LAVASSLPFGEAYPILCWIIANVSQKHSRTVSGDKRGEGAAKTLRSVFESMLSTSQVAARLATQSANVAEEAVRKAGSILLASQSKVVGPGERDEAITALRNWIATKVKGYLKISDPFFGVGELELLRWVLEDAPDTKVSILTSRKHIEKVPVPFQESFESEWRLYYSDMEPPRTKIVVASVSPDGASPIHDRWWITAGSAVRLGTSLNSLGVGKVSELSWPSPEEAAAQEQRLDPYLTEDVREQNNRRITYSSFTL
jgi:hypothetical protein